jgi:DNA-binding response OmpR family regulator
MQGIIIADDQEEKENLIFVLRRVGLAVASSSDHQRVLENWTEHPADIMVIVISENKEPLKVIEAVRAITQIPVLMIMETQSEKAFNQLLRAGADIVLVRPVSPQAFGAYIEALMRRAASLPSFVLPTLELDEISLDPSTRTVSVEGLEPRRLTQLEFRILFTLMTNRGQVIPLEILVERVWGYTGEGNQDLVRGLISRLRRKIEPDPESNRFIETIPGVGYRFIVDTI